MYEKRLIFPSVTRSFRVYFNVIILAAACLLASQASADPSNTQALLVPINSTALVTVASPMAEIVIANPQVADAYAHNTTSLIIAGKHLGQTQVKISGADGVVLADIAVTVGYDLPAIRKALKSHLSTDAPIGVEMAGFSIALTGTVASQTAADAAVVAARDVLRQTIPESDLPEIFNLLRVAPAAQVASTAQNRPMDTFFFNIIRMLAGETNPMPMPGLEGPIGFQLD